jgi:small subunit ribosomal protein S16
MKKMGRKHQPFYRICAMDVRAPRDGKVIEELGYYDPMVKETDARAILKGERISYWLSVGAQPSDKVKVLIKKYGVNGTHVEQQQAALERVKLSKPMAPPPRVVLRPKQEEPAEPETQPETQPEAEAVTGESPAAEAAPAEG